MITLTIIAVPSVLLCLALEVREGRASHLTAGLDGGIAILIGAIVFRAGNVI
jgi:hypothetical protein